MEREGRERERESEEMKGREEGRGERQSERETSCHSFISKKREKERTGNQT